MQGNEPAQSNITNSRRYTGPSAYSITERVTQGRVFKSHEWFRLQGICHGGTTPAAGGSLTLRDREDGGGIAVKCWAGCDRKTVIQALEQATGWDIWNAWERDSLTPRGPLPPAVAPTPPAPRPEPGKPSIEPHPIARTLWSQAQPINLEPDHPARAWMARRNLYPTQIPVPPAVRWIPKQRWPAHHGAGAVAALFAPPEAWMGAWPNLPAPTAIELVHIDTQGNPALDRDEADGGLTKRTHGRRSGSVCLLGAPHPALARGLHLAEGLADSLALAARFPETAAALGGTGGLKMVTLDDWLAAWNSIVVYADEDGPGIAAAREFRERRAEAGQDVRAVVLQGYGDPAAAAASVPLPLVDFDLLHSDTIDLRRDGLPWWEAARRAYSALVSREP